MLNHQISVFFFGYIKQSDFLHFIVKIFISKTNFGSKHCILFFDFKFTAIKIKMYLCAEI